MNDANSDVCIFVEGIDDALFIQALVTYSKLPETRFHLVRGNVDQLTQLRIDELYNGKSASPSVNVHKHMSSVESKGGHQ